MEDLSENENTVAVLTIYYKEKQLTNLVYDSQTLSEELGGFLNGTIKPKGTLSEIMQLIKVAGMN